MSMKDIVNTEYHEHELLSACSHRSIFCLSPTSLPFEATKVAQNGMTGGGTQPAEPTNARIR